jgi:hypothetical protein
MACGLLMDARLAPLRDRELLERTEPGVAEAADVLWAEVAGLLGR